MNRVILSGRNVRELDVKSGKTEDREWTLGNGCIAVDRDRQGAGADFINFTVYGKSAEAFANLVKKGQKILLEGKWATSAYNGKNGRVYQNTLHVEHWEFSGDRPRNEEEITGGFDPSAYEQFADDSDIPFN